MSSRTEADGSTGGGGWLVATVVLAAALRLVGLQSGLWFDEIVTLVLSARQPLSRILTEFPGVNAHPLYSLLAHASIGAFGESAWALRLPACAFGVASVVMAYRLGVSLATRTEAWAGATVLATSYHHIWFSQNARGYTMLGFFTLTSTAALLRAGAHERPREYWLYALAAAAGLYTHLTMAFVIAGHAAVVLVAWAIGWPRSTAGDVGRAAISSGHVKRLVATWLGVAALTGAAYAPFARSILAQLGSRAPHEAAKVATAGWAVSEAIRSLLSGAGVPAAVAAAALASIGALALWRRDPLAAALLVVPGIVTAVAIAALGQPIRPRFFFFLSGAAAIFFGRGLGVLATSMAARGISGRRWSPEVGVVAGTLVLVAISATALPRNYRTPKQDFDGAVRFLEAAEADGARVAAAGPACFPLQAYYRKAWPCLANATDWGAFRAAPSRALVAYTLAEHVEDAALLRSLRVECPVVRRFDATLGGGEITVCEAQPTEPRR